jgi:hypothetical protein
MPRYAGHLESFQFFETTVMRDEKIVGTIRVKASGLSWKPKGKHKYYSISFDQFDKWITSEESGSRRGTRW